jgi:GNAT superfamily N-acetyltransferase
MAGMSKDTGPAAAPEGLVVRAATATAAGDDVDDLGRIVELLRLGAVPGGPPSAENPADLSPYRAALDEIARGDGAVLVAEVDGALVGVCQLIVFRHLQARGGRCAEIESVHVHPDHRGAGIGTILLTTAMDRARDLGCYRVQLTSNAARPDAHRFYERLGMLPTHIGFKLLLE